MKTPSLLSVFLLLSVITSAQSQSQSLYVQLGNTGSTLSFENREGEELENLRATNSLFLDVGYRDKLIGDNIWIDLGIGYHQYGSVGSDPSVNNFFGWDLSYVSLNLGMHYRFLKWDKLDFYLRGTLSPEFMIRGSQTLNRQVFDLRGERDFNSPILFVKAGMSIHYPISSQVSAYLVYEGGQSFRLNDAPGKLNLITHNVGLGVHLSLNTPQISSFQDNAKIENLERQIDQNDSTIQNLIQQANRTEQSLSFTQRQVDSLVMQIARNKRNPPVPDDEWQGEFIQHAEEQGFQVTIQGAELIIILNSDSLFESGSSEIGLEDQKTIEKLSHLLTKYPYLAIFILGHTDNIPVEARAHIQDNWDLSVERALSVSKILLENSLIDPQSLTIGGKGKYSPLTSNTTEEGKSQNRRIEIILTSNK